MNDKEIKEIIEGTYDDSREDTIRSIVSDFYSRKLLSTAILVWVWAMIFFAGAVYSAIQFFDVDDTKSQIMYVAIFVPCVICIGFMKVFAWGMVHRHQITELSTRLMNIYRIIEWHFLS